MSLSAEINARQGKNWGSEAPLGGVLMPGEKVGKRNVQNRINSGKL